MLCADIEITTCRSLFSPLSGASASDLLRKACLRSPNIGNPCLRIPAMGKTGIGTFFATFKAKTKTPWASTQLESCAMQPPGSNKSTANMRKVTLALVQIPSQTPTDRKDPCSTVAGVTHMSQQVIWLLWTERSFGLKIRTKRWQHEAFECGWQRTCS